VSVSLKLEGLGDVVKVLKELEAEIGDKALKSKILVPAVREAMRPVLQAAIQNAPKDTGGLSRSMRIEARRPNRKDRRSKYVFSNDTVIATVTTAPGKVLAKRGIKSDARAIAQEFGTAKHAAKPYMRPALEANAQSVVDRLAKIILKRIEKFRKK
tara:strand:- start:395 stop:862 length:468 start_codon:yes stop_codon:yes gene_type:complete